MFNRTVSWWWGLYVILVLLLLPLAASAHEDGGEGSVGRNLCALAKSAGPELMDAIIDSLSPTTATFDADAYCTMFCGLDQAYCFDACNFCLDRGEWKPAWERESGLPSGVRRNY